MKKVVLVTLGVFGTLIVAILVAASLQPDVSHVERSRVLRASPEAIMPHLTDMKRWVAWSPWAERDPDVEWTFSDPPAGEGAWYTWQGNEEVGKGRMEVTSVEGSTVRYALTFIEPFASEADVALSIAPHAEGTEVVWEMDTKNTFASKAFMLFMDFDAMIGLDFEQGLAKLAERVEASDV